MAFSDPQTVTVNAVAIVMPRTGSDINAGTFTSADGQSDLVVSHQVSRRGVNRVRFHQVLIASDPYLPAANIPIDHSVTLTYNGPKTGFTAAQKKQLVDGFLAWLSASSGANITKLLGFEN